jgi:hypothetical protein
MKRLACALVALLCLHGPASAQTPAPEDDQEAFSLQIDIGRHGVLIDHALDGLGVALPYVARDDDGLGADAEDLWRGLREAGREGVILKEIACAKRVVGPKRCAAFEAPTWISAQPTPVPSLATLRTYEEELGAALDPFVEAGCAAGRRRDKDPMFCSVE